MQGRGVVQRQIAIRSRLQVLGGEYALIGELIAGAIEDIEIYEQARGQLAKMTPFKRNELLRRYQRAIDWLEGAPVNPRRSYTIAACVDFLNSRLHTTFDVETLVNAIRFPPEGIAA